MFSAFSLHTPIVTLSCPSALRAADTRETNPVPEMGKEFQDWRGRFKPFPDKSGFFGLKTVILNQ